MLVRENVDRLYTFMIDEIYDPMIRREELGGTSVGPAKNNFNLAYKEAFETPEALAAREAAAEEAELEEADGSSAALIIAIAAGAIVVALIVFIICCCKKCKGNR